MTASASVITTRDVRKYFRDGAELVHAVDGVSMQVEQGEMVCLYGASGSGKSTLLNLVAGLELPDSGSVQVMGVEFATASENERADARLKRVGVIFQDDNLIDEFSAVENVALPLIAHGASFREATDAAVESLAKVELAELKDRRPAALSGGQRQRVGIARALVGSRSILVADEPTGALDSDNSHALFRLVRDLCKSGDLTALVATHDPLAGQYCDRMLMMTDGRVAPTE